MFDNFVVLCVAFRIEFYCGLKQMIHEHDLDNCWQLKPLLNGRTVRLLCSRISVPRCVCFR